MKECEYCHSVGDSLRKCSYCRKFGCDDCVRQEFDSEEQWEYAGEPDYFGVLYNFVCRPCEQKHWQIYRDYSLS